MKQLTSEFEEIGKTKQIDNSVSKNNLLVSSYFWVACEYY